MFDYKENRLCWVINVATEAHGEILKIIASLDSDVYDSTNYWGILHVIYLFVSSLLQW